MQGTPGYCKTLGVPLFLGRHFVRDEGAQGKDHVVIPTHRLWPLGGTTAHGLSFSRSQLLYPLGVAHGVQNQFDAIRDPELFEDAE